MIIHKSARDLLNCEDMPIIKYRPISACYFATLRYFFTEYGIAIIYPNFYEVAGDFRSFKLQR